MACKPPSTAQIFHRLVGTCGLCLAAIVGGATAADAQRLENKVAVFAALDKVTAKIRRLEIPLDETIEFGTLKVTPRVCFTRPLTERPKTTTFVEIEEVKLDGTQSRLFSGWMFAQSPGLNAVEHPVFDIWLTDCEKPKNAPAASVEASPIDGEAGSGKDEPPPRRRPRRRVRR